MSDALAIYLHNHLAGSHFAVNLLDSVNEQYSNGTLGRFALDLKADITWDQDVLQAIIDQVGKSGVDLTEAAGWLAEKASQLKLKRDDSEGGLGLFEALETLMLGIRGKLLLWQVLPVIREVDARVPDKDYAELAARAKEQYDRVESQRLKSALTAFAR
jgi:hypothetical protein